MSLLKSSTNERLTLRSTAFQRPTFKHDLTDDDLALSNTIKGSGYKSI